MDDGRIALIVGDCVGHGLTAATVMGQLRSACQALLFENHSPGAALAGLDRFAARLSGAKCTTAFCGVLDTETGELVYSRAGHPPPILVHADRTTQMLEDGGTLPLGVRPDWPRSEARITMPARATLLLYTDGLVERRRHPLDQGIARAADLVQHGRDAALDDLASQIMFGLAPTGGYQDDVALLLYRQPAPLEVDIPADAGHLADAREALRSWLTRAGVKPDQNLNVLIAAGEAVTNAIEHGHRDSAGGVVSLRATTLVDRLSLTVTDDGSWKTPEPSSRKFRGRGITLMRALMHDVTIDPADAGTTVHLQARIS
jgi:anti-sigma regulatory factor (Ser/Thr protein kinase)